MINLFDLSYVSKLDIFYSYYEYAEEYKKLQTKRKKEYFYQIKETNGTVYYLKTDLPVTKENFTIPDFLLVNKSIHKIIPKYVEEITKEEYFANGGCINV